MNLPINLKQHETADNMHSGAYSSECSEMIAKKKIIFFLELKKIYTKLNTFVGKGVLQIRRWDRAVLLNAIFMFKINKLTNYLFTYA